MRSFLYAQLNITDRDEYKKYEEGFIKIFPKYNGEIIVIEENPIILEGQWTFTRIVLISFPSEDDLRKFYDSEEYQELAEIRKRASSGNVLILNEWE